MKEYFAKYLPVEGRIKDGDTILVSNSSWIEEYKGIKLVKNVFKDGLITYEVDKPDSIETITVDDCKKAKLFLCSKEISCSKCGETENLHSNFDYSKSTPLLTNILCNECGNTFEPFKVIGEISPNAKWVKEGDEFDEAEISFRYTLPVNISNPAHEWIEYPEFAESPTDEDISSWLYEFCHFNGGRGGNWELSDIKVSRIKIKCPCCGDFK